EQADLVRDTGSVSGADTDKFEKFNIDFFKGESINALVPSGAVGWIECRLKSEHEEGTALVIGEAVKAFGDKRGFKNRVYPENREGRTLHHLGPGEFGVISENVDKN
ncbi:MAG: flavin reductase family protein, partial [Elusimicrobiota bacterium]|nr:flavin reductase family protein [Elusimicrobiota bacterium]